MTICIFDGPEEMEEFDDQQLMKRYSTEDQAVQQLKYCTDKEVDEKKAVDMEKKKAVGMEKKKTFDMEKKKVVDMKKKKNKNASKREKTSHAILADIAITDTDERNKLDQIVNDQIQRLVHVCLRRETSTTDQIVPATCYSVINIISGHMQEIFERYTLMKIQETDYYLECSKIQKFIKNMSTNYLKYMTSLCTSLVDNSRLAGQLSECTLEFCTAVKARYERDRSRQTPVPKSSNKMWQASKMIATLERKIVDLQRLNKAVALDEH